MKNNRGKTIVKENQLISSASLIPIWKDSPKQLMDDIYRIAEDDCCSIVLHSVQTATPNLHQFCKELARETGKSVNCNLYLNGPNSQGFGFHRDDRDAIILQISGKKKWFIYPDSNLSQHSQIQDDLMKIIELEQDDFIFLPKDIPHMALTENGSSCHLTLALV